MKTNLLLLLSIIACIFLNLATDAQIPTNGVVGYYPFNGNAQDMSGNSNNGTVNNAVLCQDRFGNANSAYEFNGTNSFIQIANPSQFNMAGAFTLSMWCRINTSASNLGAFFSKSNPSAWVDNDKAIDHNAVRNIGTDICAFGAPHTVNSISNYQWYHLVWVYGITYSTVYINAVPQVMDYNWSNLPFPADNPSSIVCIGKQGDGRYFNGQVDDIRFYNWALSQNGITSLFNENQNSCLGTWTTKAAMPTPRSSAGSAVVNGKLYVIGGFLGTNANTGIVEEYDPSTNTWTTKSPMPTIRQYFGVAVVNNKIYCVGGSYMNSNRLTVNEVYDPQTNTWATETPMPTGRAGLSCEAVNGKIYAIGGMTTWISPGTNIVEEYNPVTQLWTTKQPIPTASGDFATAVCNNEIHVFGGTDGSLIALNLHEVYYPLNNTWNTLSPLPTPRYSMKAKTLSGKIYVIGGATTYPYTMTGANQVYDPLTNSWVTQTTMPTLRISFCLENVNNKLYAIGGQISDYGTLNTNEEFSSTEPVITSQPQNQTICKNGATSFTIIATGASLTYQWYKDGVMLSNGNLPTYSVSNAQSSDIGNYYCIATNNCGNCQSSSATLNVIVVTPPSILGATVVNGLSVQTYSVSTTSGSTYSFSVVNGSQVSVTANSITVQWGSTGVGQIICTETSSMGCVSEPSILNVTILGSPTITLQPQPQTICKNSNTSFTVGSSGSSPFYYTWYKDGNQLPNGNQPTYNLNNAQPADAGNYYCVVNNANGSVQSNYAALMVVVVTPPTIWGSALVPEWSVQTYSVTQIAGSLYAFSIVGGNILSTTANSVTVQWGSIGYGQVICTETNSMGCVSDQSNIIVAIGSVGIQEPIADKIAIYPNPTSGKINISSEKNMQTITIFNSFGAKIAEENVENQQFSFDLAQYGRGVYFISIEDGNSLINRKIVVN